MKLFTLTLLAIALGSVAFIVSASPSPGTTHLPSSTASLSPTTFQVDSTHSNVIFKTNHLGVSEFFGRFNTVTGEIQFEKDDPTESTVLIEIPVASLDTNDAKRDGHLKSADFFSAKEFPSMIFESTSVRSEGGKMHVKGMLTVRDVSKEIDVEFKKIGEAQAMGAYRMGFSAAFQIDMRDFGFQFVEQQPGAVGPEVQLWVALELTKS